VIVNRAAFRPDQHPSNAPVVIEVSGDSIAKDRRVKRAIYARAGIDEYVIVDVDRRGLEVYRDPIAATSDYRSREILAVPDRFVSVAVAGVSFALADLFDSID